MLDEHDREFAGLDGSMTIRLHDDAEWLWNGEGAEQEVRVEGGHFVFEVPNAEQEGGRGLVLSLEALLVDGRPGYGEQASFEVPARGEAVVRGRWFRETTLRVFTAATGGELSKVQMLRGLAYRLRRHPGPEPFDGSTAVEVSAPVVVDPPRELGLDPGEEELWLRSDGSRWQRVLVDHRHGGEGRVFLESGGDLVVEIVGEMPPTYRVELSAIEHWDPDWGSPHDQVLAEARGEEAGSLVFRGLPLGPVGVWVEEVRPDDALERRVGRATAEVVATGASTVTISLSWEKRPGAPLSGTLSIDPSWLALARQKGAELSMLGLSIIGEDPLRFFREVPPEEFSPVPGRPGLWSWDAGTVPLGTHRVDYKVMVEREVEVGPGGARDVSIVIPALSADVEVCIVDERTGEVIRGGWLSWKGRPLSGQRSHGDGSWDPERGSFRLFTFSGALTLDLGHETHYLPVGSRILSVPAGASRHRIAARPMCALVLWTRSHGLPVPAPEMLSGAELDAGEGANAVIHVNVFERKVTYFVSEPGSYELRFPELDGFRTPETMLVEIVEGFTDRFVDLVKEG